MKINFTCFTLLLLFFFDCSMLKSNPGDTTWVTVYNQRKLTYHGNYDTTAVFPTGKRYRKIRLHYTIGRYACPNGTQYCGSWDYTTQLWARHSGMDTVEIAKVITPYATDWLNLKREHTYIVDVSDYAQALEGNTGLRFRYDGYSWGFTVTLKLEFIEGTPVMDVNSVGNIYDGYFPFGNASKPIENYLVAKTRSYSTGKAFIKNSVSGHGADGTNCAEFCNKYYQLKIDNNLVAQKQLWRSDCGYNHVFPQTGTWIYDRANWCPGAVVWPIYHDISGVTAANQPFSVDVDMQPYTISAPSAGYNWVSQYINYSDPNHVRDISIEDILAPTTDANYARFNPACRTPIIRVRNAGRDSVKSIGFEYGMNGKTAMSYTWTGALGFLQTIDMPFPASATALSGTTSAVFGVTVTSVNGIKGDENTFNNIYSTPVKPAAVFPSEFVVKMFTNNSTDAPTQANETTWELSDENGNVLFSRNGLANSTTYHDTISLAPGCYKMEIRDAGCDGMSWWANTQGGSGSMRVHFVNSSAYFFSFPGDIGCGFTKYFIVETPVDYTGIPAFAPETLVEVFPNPAGSEFFIRFDIPVEQNVSYSVNDLQGRQILTAEVNAQQTSLHRVDASKIPAGLYLVQIKAADGSSQVRKIVITD